MSPLWHLTLARFREFYREPAALFWVYGFPLVLAFALGLAFSEKPLSVLPRDQRVALGAVWMTRLLPWMIARMGLPCVDRTGCKRRWCWNFRRSSADTVPA